MGKIFADIFGQKNATRILSAQLESGNISHAYLFLGNEGTGKEYLATEFARYLLCENHADDSCENCTQFYVGAHPDFIYVDGHAGIKIDTVREVIERINLSPNLSKRKVLFFSRAENLGIEAANALLKTLEEPPADAILLLTAISEKSLPETISSRVQKIKLNPLSPADIKKILLQEFSPEQIEAVTSFAEGSVGKAKRLLENPAEFENKKQLYADATKLFRSKSLVERFMMLEKYDKAKELKSLFDTFGILAFEALEQILAGGSTAGQDFLPVDIGAEKLVAISQKVLKIYADLDYNVNLKIAFENLLLEQLLND
jgi:DNA polymerase-3 subunit delta'